MTGALPVVAGRAAALGAFVLAVVVASSPGTAAENDYLHVVAPGESLAAIAHRLLEPPHDWRSLGAVNGLRRPALIRPGQTIRVPWGWLRLERVEATVAAVEGSASVDGRELARDARVGENRAIRTGEASTVVLRLPDGSELRIPPASEVRIERLRRYFQSQSLDARFSLERGRVEARARAAQEPSPPDAPARRLEIRTPKATAAVRGTVFRVGESDAFATTEVLEGAVDWSGRQRGSPVAAGFGSSADRTGSVTPPEPLLAAPRLAAGATAFQTVDAWLRFDPVAGARAYRIAVSRDAGGNRVVVERVATQPELRFVSPEDGEYFVRARALSPTGVEGFDGVQRLVVAARPEPPRPASPAPGSAHLVGEVALAWIAPAGDARFRVQVGADARFERVLADETVATTRYAYREPTTSRIDGPTMRFWRVATVAAGRTGPFSAAQPFEWRPGAPSPEAGSDGTGLVASWAGVAGGSYEVQIARTADFATDARVLARDAPSVRFDDLTPGVWYVRIRTLYRDGVATPFGQTRRVRIPLPVVDGRGAPLRAGSGGVVERAN